jgi:hypothetical protein
MRRRLLSLLVLASVPTLAPRAVALPAAAPGIAAPKQYVPTGHQQVYTVPSGVLLVGVLVVGGWGGSDDPQPSGSQIGSAGASLQGYLATRPGEVLYAEVGQNGTAGGGTAFGGGGAAGASRQGCWTAASATRLSLAQDHGQDQAAGRATYGPAPSWWRLAPEEVPRPPRG